MPVAVTPEKSQYELERDERIKRNAAFLESLGLGPNGDAKLPKKKMRPPMGPRAPRAKVPLSERRRSARINGGEGHTPPTRLTYDEWSDDERPRKRVRARRATVEACGLSEAERAALGAWDMEAFEDFLTYDHPISEDNRKQVMRQATKLVSGAGVHYASPTYGWPPGVIFRKGEPVKVTDDIVAITYAAKAFEDEHGRDHGNGWLLNHPLRKLIIYQQHLAVRERAAGIKTRAKRAVAVVEA